MTLVPPEGIRILQTADLKTFGLEGKDPVFAELIDNLEASLAHVSKSEFLSRKAKSERCKREGFEQLRQASHANEVDLLEFARMNRECDEQTIYKDVIKK